MRTLKDSSGVVMATFCLDSTISFLEYVRNSKTNIEDAIKQAKEMKEKLIVIIKEIDEENKEIIKK